MIISFLNDAVAELEDLNPEEYRSEYENGLSWALGDLELKALELPNEAEERLIQAWDRAEAYGNDNKREPRKDVTITLLWEGSPLPSGSCTGPPDNPS